MTARLMLCILAVVLQMGVTVAQTPGTMRSAEAVQLGRRQCVRIQAGDEYATAVLVDARPTNSGQVRLIVATAFHAVANAKNLVLAVEQVDASGEPRTLADSANDACEVAVDPATDVAFVRFVLKTVPPSIELKENKEREFVLEFRKNGADVVLAPVGLKAERLAKLPTERLEAMKQKAANPGISHPRPTASAAVPAHTTVHEERSETGCSWWRRSTD
jgi:hypothetical protein